MFPYLREEGRHAGSRDSSHRLKTFDRLSSLLGLFHVGQDLWQMLRYLSQRADYTEPPDRPSAIRPFDEPLHGSNIPLLDTGERTKYLHRLWLCLATASSTFPRFAPAICRHDCGFQPPHRWRCYCCLNCTPRSLNRHARQSLRSQSNIRPTNRQSHTLIYRLCTDESDLPPG